MIFGCLVVFWVFFVIPGTSQEGSRRTMKWGLYNYGSDFARELAELTWPGNFLFS